MNTLWMTVTLILGYLFGSVNAAVIITKYVLNQDVREAGSQNAGATNVARVFGYKIGLLTLLGDFVKTAVAMALGRLIGGEHGVYLAAMGCMLGHCWPLYFNFRGGKGVSVGACIVLFVDWRVFLLILAVFFLVFFWKRRVSLASMLAAAMIPVGFILVGRTGLWELLLAFFLPVVVVFLHRGNIRRLLNHTEPEFQAKRH